MATKKKNSTTKQKEVNKAKSDINAVILFAVALFMLFLVFIKGQNVWTAIHNFVFGIFGVMAYVLPFLIGFIAVVYALGKTDDKLGAKATESSILFLLVSSCINVFSIKEIEGISFFRQLSDAYLSGVEKKNGGFLGALLGNPIYLAFGKTAAAITLIILIFVFLMIITGTTLITFFKTVSKPVTVVSKQAENVYKDRANRIEAIKEAKKGDIVPFDDYDIDVPIDEEKKTKRSRKTEPQKEENNEKQQKLIDTYREKDTDIIKEIPSDNDAVSEALESIDKEYDDYSDAEEQPQKISVDFEKETAKVSKEIDENSNIINYRYPPYELLKLTNSSDIKALSKELDSTADHLVEILRSFGVETRILDISKGPTVTRYELQPCAGVKISKITGLADDIALNLAAAGVRIEAPIPNKAAVGIEIPNKASSMVGVREIIESSAFTASKSKLTVAMGRDIGGNVVVGDIAKMPHGLIAGATGSGKSVCINSIIMSILYKASPEEVKLLMIDPKVVELGVYNGIPHLLVPVVTDPRKAAGALGWAVSEMEKRYTMFADRGVRDIEGYNRFVETLTNEPEVTKMPHIVIIIDELADLMMTAPSEVEDSINRIAAKARAAGMHLLIATQRPSVDVVTGVIKANIPTRIAFAVSSQIDSRTILDAGGAEKLLGKGDMLFSPIGSNKPKRVQGCFVSDGEVEKVVDFVKHNGNTKYDDNIMVEIERQAAMEKQKKTGLPEDGPEDDPMLDEAIKVVVEMGQASTSLLQRKLKLGYARAARIVDEMESRGVVGPYEGSKPRKVLITKEQLMEREATTSDTVTLSDEEQD